MVKQGILCIDDEAILTLAITRALKSAFGSEVHVDAASSAAEAFETIDELKALGVKVDVVICDLYMPGVRGDEFLRNLGQRHPEVRGILLSGIPEGEEQTKLAKELGLFAFLSKPVKNSDLIRIVGEALASARFS